MDHSTVQNYFDIGVTRASQKVLEHKLVPSTSVYGETFEHFLILEIKRLAAYKKPDWTFSYLITKDDAEIDLIIERPGLPLVAIEIKSTCDLNKLEKSSLNSFSKLVRDLGNCKAYLLSQDPIEQKRGEVICLPWKKGIMHIGL